MIILESSVLIDYLNGKITPHTDWLDQNADATQMGLTDLILYEVLRGVREDKRLAAVQEELQQFSLWPTMTPGLEVRSAENYRRLRQRGITIRSTIDCLIATFCIESGHTLLHNDRDFDPFEQHLGLQVIHPEAV